MTFLIFMILSTVIGAFAWPYGINTWLDFMGKPEVVTWWMGALLGVIPIVGRYGLPAAAITWIIMLFI